MHISQTSNTGQKWSFPLRISLVNMTKSAGTADLVAFTEEIFNGKLHCLCSEKRQIVYEADGQSNDKRYWNDCPIWTILTCKNLRLQILDNFITTSKIAKATTTKNTT